MALIVDQIISKSDPDLEQKPIHQIILKKMLWSASLLNQKPHGLNHEELVYAWACADMIGEEDVCSTDLDKPR